MKTKIIEFIIRTKLLQLQCMPDEQTRRQLRVEIDDLLNLAGGQLNIKTISHDISRTRN